MSSQGQQWADGRQKGESRTPLNFTYAGNKRSPAEPHIPIELHPNLTSGTLSVSCQNRVRFLLRVNGSRNSVARSLTLLKRRTAQSSHAAFLQRIHEGPESASLSVILLLDHRWPGPPRNQGATRLPPREIFVPRSCVAYFLTKFSSVRPVPQVALWPLRPAGDSVIRTTPQSNPAVKYRPRVPYGPESGNRSPSNPPRPAQRTPSASAPCRKPGRVFPWTPTTAGAGISASSDNQRTFTSANPSCKSNGSNPQERKRNKLSCHAASREQAHEQS